MLFENTILESCQASSRAEPWTSLSWLLSQDPSPVSALLQYVLRALEAPGLEHRGSCEIENEGRRSSVDLGWRCGLELELKIAPPPFHMSAALGLLTSDHSFWLKRIYQRMQEKPPFFLSSAIGEFCGSPSCHQFTTRAFIKEWCPRKCETWDPANTERNQICLEMTSHLPCHEMERQLLCMDFLILYKIFFCKKSRYFVKSKKAAWKVHRISC